MSRPHVFLLFSAISAAALVCSPCGHADAQPAPRVIKERSSSYLGIYAITPSRGTVRGGTRIDIAFSIPFARGPYTVFIGERPATEVTTISAGAVSATTPPGIAGPAHVRVCSGSSCATDTSNPMFDYLPLRPLVIAGRGNGAGYVTGAGVDCAVQPNATSSSCLKQLDDGDTVTLTAVAAPGSSFVGWESACAGTSTCAVTMDTAKLVQAVFDGENDDAMLEVLNTGGGSGRVTGGAIDCGTHCVALVTPNSQIVLHAEASLGSVFLGWSAICTATGDCSLTPADTTTVMATFAPAYTQFLAEGATIGTFDVRLSVANRSYQAGMGVFEFLRTDGVVITHRVALPPRTSILVEPKGIAGLEAAEFATILSSDVPVVLERTMSWGSPAADSHTVVASPATATAWYFAEGTTHAEFNTFYLLANPGPEPTSGTIEFMLPTGRAAPPMAFSIAPRSRLTIWLNDVPGLADTDVGGIVRVDNGSPGIVAERAVYKDVAGQPMVAGHASLGAILGRDWVTVLTEGATGPYFDTFVLIANPHALSLPFRAAFLRADGQVFEKEYRIAPKSRLTLWLDREEIPEGSGEYPLADTAVTTHVNTETGRTMTDPYALVVERSMWWPGTQWTATHVGSAIAYAPPTVTKVAFADGEVGGSRNAETYLLVEQFTGRVTSAGVTLLFEDGTEATQRVSLQPFRNTFNLGVDILPEARGRRFGIIVESYPDDVLPRPQPLAVERSMYWDEGGRRWAAGTSGRGAPIP